MKEVFRKGLSGIIKTLLFLSAGILIILISFMAIKILAVGGISNFLSGTSRINLKIISVHDSGQGIDVNIKRNPGKGELAGIKFVITDGIVEEVFTKNETIGEIENRTFNLDYNALIKKISIAPIIQEGEEIVAGKIIDEKEFSDEEIVKSIAGLVSWWKFEDNVRDEINRKDGVQDGITFADGIDGKAGSFDGVDDSVEIGDFDSENSISAEFWYKRDSLDTANSEGIIGNMGWSFFVSSRRGWKVEHPQSSNSLNFVLELTDGNNVKEFSVNSPPLKTKEWYYVVCIFDSEKNEIKIFVNGELKNSEPVPEGYRISESSSELVIGYAPTKGYFHGEIDDVRIYSVPLSENEIRALYGLYFD
jgi:hypothetical protein